MKEAAAQAADSPFPMHGAGAPDLPRTCSSLALKRGAAPASSWGANPKSGAEHSRNSIPGPRALKDESHPATKPPEAFPPA